MYVKKGSLDLHKSSFTNCRSDRARKGTESLDQQPVRVRRKKGGRRYYITASSSSSSSSPFHIHPITYLIITTAQRAHPTNPSANARYLTPQSLLSHPSQIRNLITLLRAVPRTCRGRGAWRGGDSSPGLVWSGYRVVRSAYKIPLSDRAQAVRIGPWKAKTESLIACGDVDMELPLVLPP